MKAWWAIQAARINALSLRERLFLFLSVIVVILAVVDVLWLTPSLAAYKQTQQRFVAQSAEVNRLRAELALASTPVDASAGIRTDLVEFQARVDALNAEVAALAPGAAGSSDALEQVLVRFLKRSPGLHLVSTGTVANESVLPVAVAVPGVERRGLELRVAGPYPDLIRYVQSLEQALPRLRWGSMHLVVDKSGPELTLRVYVLEVQP